METILEMIRHVVIFLLIATLVGNLFMGTEYKKYFAYAVSLIVVVMVLAPLMQIFGKEGDWKDYLLQADYRQQAEKTREEIELLGEEYEEKIQSQYVEQIREAIASQCGTARENCELKMEGQQIRMITVQVEQMPEQVTSLVSSLALCYGVDEKNIFIKEAAG